MSTTALVKQHVEWWLSRTSSVLQRSGGREHTCRTLQLMALLYGGAPYSALASTLRTTRQVLRVGRAAAALQAAPQRRLLQRRRNVPVLLQTARALLLAHSGIDSVLFVGALMDRRPIIVARIAAVLHAMRFATVATALMQSLLNLPDRRFILAALIFDTPFVCVRMISKDDHSPRLRVAMTFSIVASLIRLSMYVKRPQRDADPMLGDDLA